MKSEIEGTVKKGTVAYLLLDKSNRSGIQILAEEIQKIKDRLDEKDADNRELHDRGDQVQRYGGAPNYGPALSSYGQTSRAERRDREDRYKQWIPNPGA